MTIAIECYIAACTLLLLFEICFLFLKNAKIQQLKPDHEAFEEELSREIRLHYTDGWSETFADKKYDNAAEYAGENAKGNQLVPSVIVGTAECL